MVGGSADISRIGAIMFQKVHAGLFEECMEAAEIILAPSTLQTGRDPKHAPRFARLGIDNVVLWSDTAAGQQGISAQFNPFAVRVVGQPFERGKISGVLVFHVESAPKR